MTVVRRVFASLLPLAATPLLGYGLAGGVLDLGGGEKDLVLLLPWILWSLVFAVSSWILWRRGRAFFSGLWRAGLIGIAGLVLAALLLAAVGQLGVAGRF